MATVPRGEGGARGHTRARVEAGHPLQHRPGLHRRVDDADRRAVRALDRRLGDRLVQAGQAALADVRRADRRGRTRTRRRPPPPRTPPAHVGPSLFHDVAPAMELGLPTVWINRLGEAPEPQPDVELHSLTGLADA